MAELPADASWLKSELVDLTLEHLSDDRGQAATTAPSAVRPSTAQHRSNTPRPGIDNMAPAPPSAHQVRQPPQHGLPLTSTPQNAPMTLNPYYYYNAGLPAVDSRADSEMRLQLNALHGHLNALGQDQAVSRSRLDALQAKAELAQAIHEKDIRLMREALEEKSMQISKLAKRVDEFTFEQHVLDEARDSKVEALEKLVAELVTNSTARGARHEAEMQGLKELAETKNRAPPTDKNSDDNSVVGGVKIPKTILMEKSADTITAVVPQKRARDQSTEPHPSASAQNTRSMTALSTDNDGDDDVPLAERLIAGKLSAANPSFVRFLQKMDCRNEDDLRKLQKYVKGVHTRELRILEDKDRLFFLKVGHTKKKGGLRAQKRENCRDMKNDGIGQSVLHAATAQVLQVMECATEQTLPSGYAFPAYAVLLGEVFAKHLNSSNVSSTGFHVIMDVTTPEKTLWLVFLYDEVDKAGEVVQQRKMQPKNPVRELLGGLGHDMTRLADSIHACDATHLHFLPQDSVKTLMIKHRARGKPWFIKPIPTELRKTIHEGWNNVDGHGDITDAKAGKQPTRQASPRV